jgi:UPF0755 protein
MVTIPKGMDVRSIGTLLHERGIISHEELFVLVARLWGKDGALQAGQYAFPPQNSLVSVLDRLSRGEVHSIQVTIPEGLTVHEIGHRLKKAAVVDSSALVRLCGDGDFIRSLNIDASHLEGYLFPNTYMIFWEMVPEEAIKFMVEAWHGVFTEEFREKAEQLEMTVHEVMTLASIIEREVMHPEERTIISGIFHNRLKLNRALESCATVEYVLGEHKPRLTQEDLQVPSPYNTYLHRGLPPGPICNPGQAAIHAALYPDDVDYLYFVSQGNGRHIFSKSLEEHVRAKHRVRREMRNRKP